MPYVPPRSRHTPPRSVAPLSPQPVAPTPPLVAAEAPKPTPSSPATPPDDVVLRRERARPALSVERLSLADFEPDPRAVVAALFGG